MTSTQWLILFSVPLYMLAGLVGLFSVRKNQWNKVQYKEALEVSILLWVLLSSLWCIWLFFKVTHPNAPIQAMLPKDIVVASA